MTREDGCELRIICSAFRAFAVRVLVVEQALALTTELTSPPENWDYHDVLEDEIHRRQWTICGN